jgi:hypothetical protein
MRWVPSKDRFIPVSDRFSNLGQARSVAGEERLRDRDSQFAVFDRAGNMVENEAGQLVA